MLFNYLIAFNKIFVILTGEKMLKNRPVKNDRSIVQFDYSLFLLVPITVLPKQKLILNLYENPVTYV